MIKTKGNYKSKKRARYLRFMQSITDVGMYAIAAWFISLLMCTVVPNYVAVKYAFVIISGLWISSFIFWIINHRTKLEVNISKMPHYLFVGNESDIQVNVKVKKGYLKNWKIRLCTNNYPDKKEDYIFYLWLYNPSMKKWTNRWAVQNNVGFYEEELSPLAIEDGVFDGQKETFISFPLKVFGRKRGVANIDHIKIGRTDPLGWLQFNKTVSISPEEINIIPKPQEISSWPSAKAKSALLREKEKTQRRLTQNGEEWVGLREARYNDPMKNTHWKSLAKTGKRWIIEKEETFQSKMALVIDPVLGKDKDLEDFEALMETVSGQVMNTSSSNEISWVFINSDPINANGNNHNAWNKVIEKLPSMNPLEEKITNDSWESFIPYWKKVVAIRVITTRNHEELSDWLNKWKELNIDVEIVEIKSKGEQ